MELFSTYMYLSLPIQQRDCNIQICCEYNDDSFILSAVRHFVVIHYISFSVSILINIRCQLFVYYEWHWYEHPCTYLLVNYGNDFDGYLPNNGNCCIRVFDKEFSKVVWTSVTNITMWAFRVLFILNRCSSLIVGLSFPFARTGVVTLVVSHCGFLVT